MSRASSAPDGAATRVSVTAHLGLPDEDVVYSPPMTPPRKRLSYLLLQARDPGDPMAAHEAGCFVQTLGGVPDAFDTHDLLSGPPSLDKVRRYDVLLVGGSGEYSVLGPQSWVKAFIDFLSDVVVGHRVPTFASCFGFQGLVLAGGGAVVKDEQNSEVGTFDVHLTDAGAADPLLSGLAPHFKAQLGHSDRAERLPSGMLHLAYTSKSPYQAIRLEGTDVFATQFHPELDREANTLRYMRYLEYYRQKGVGDDDDDPVLAAMADSPHASSLLKRFAESLQRSV